MGFVSKNRALETSSHKICWLNQFPWPWPLGSIGICWFMWWIAIGYLAIPVSDLLIIRSSHRGPERACSGPSTAISVTTLSSVRLHLSTNSSEPSLAVVNSFAPSQYRSMAQLLSLERDISQARFATSTELKYICPCSNVVYNFHWGMAWSKDIKSKCHVSRSTQRLGLSPVWAEALTRRSAFSAWIWLKVAIWWAKPQRFYGGIWRRFQVVFPIQKNHRIPQWFARIRRTYAKNCKNIDTNCDRYGSLTPPGFQHLPTYNLFGNRQSLCPFLPLQLRVGVAPPRNPR
jgi:hypothetical protein